MSAANDSAQAAAAQLFSNLLGGAGSRGANMRSRMEARGDTTTCRPGELQVPVTQCNKECQAPAWS